MIRPPSRQTTPAPGWLGSRFWIRWPLTAALMMGLLITPSSGILVAVCAPQSIDIGPKSFGVGIAGPEFSESHLPGTLGTDYVYPSDSARFQYFASHGLTLVRLPVRWERVQPEAFGPLSAADVAGIRAVLDAAAAHGQMVILDLHNFGSYYGKPLDRADSAVFADVWERLAQDLDGHPALFGYELMNEPHDLPGGSESWAYLAQTATDAIRKYDRSAWVLVPGYGWQSAQLWPDNNATLDVHDPAGRLLYAAHAYFDRDSTGTYARSYDADGASACVGVERLQPFLDWLDRRAARGILTEYSIPDDDPRWLTVLDRFLAALAADPQIVGGTYWSAGPWWGSYPLSVEPSNGRDRPQAAVLFTYLSRR